MKKLLFILLLLPAFAALGHDIYFFTQNQDKGFRLSDLGKLWDTYHKESHDQWKVKVDEFGATISDVIGESEQKNAQPTEQKAEETQTKFAEGFAQEDSASGTKERTAIIQEPMIKENTKGLKKFIGFLLEQKAVFVFAAIPAILFILNALIGFLCRTKKKSSDSRSFKPKKGKYTYGRK